MKKILSIVLCLAMALPCLSPARAEGANVQILLGEDAITATSQAVRIDGHTVTIVDKGVYTISGSLENGQIIVDAGKKDDVTLILSGVTVTNSTVPALMIEKAHMTVLQLAEGTENALISGTATDVLTAEADADAQGGAIHARDDLRIEGEGTLIVGGYLNNGIHTSNHLTIASGSITVEAVNHGVKGKDSVTVEGGALDVTAGKDGLVSDDTTGEGYGVVTVSGGTLTLRTSGDGIQAETLLSVTGGALDITSGGGSADVTYDAPDDWGGWRGGFEPGADFGESNEDTVSTKGLKSGETLIISGGIITVDAADDAIHSNGSITISGGAMTLSSGDDAIHADDALTVEDGIITVLASYEGMEANQILIAGGVMDIVSADDGLNAYGGQSMFGMGRMGGFGGNRGGRGSFGGFGGFGGPTGSGGPADSDKPDEPPEEHKTEATPLLRITGGTIHINAEGDGLDSNGNIIVEGGEIIVDGPFRGGNGAIDVGSENGGTCVISGGVVLAIGAAGMAETFDGTSTQCSFHVTMQGVAAGDEIVITASDGTELYRHTAAKGCASIVFSCPDLTLGETYTVTAGQRATQITLDSVSTGGSQSMWRRH